MSKHNPALQSDQPTPCQLFENSITWQVQEQQLQNLRTKGVQLGAEEEHTAAQRAYHCIEEVEYLLGGPTVLWYTDLDTNQLHL